MILIKSARTVSDQVSGFRAAGRQIGFVPTMGALHEGHLTLIRSARQVSGTTCCSIFVNPTQFNVASDFEKYPVSTAADVAMLEKEATDILFLPPVPEIYPAGTGGLERYDLGPLEKTLEGEFRPGHFQGVCQVMSRLLNIIKPSHLFMGQKDYQQCMVVSRLIHGMGIDTRLEVVPTVREADGLAMSSRNRRLTTGQRAQAPAIYNTLKRIRETVQAGPTAALKKTGRAALEAEGFRVDYLAIADAATLAPVDDWNGQQPIVALIAAFLGDVRLIDNLPLSPS